MENGNCDFWKAIFLTFFCYFCVLKVLAYEFYMELYCGLKNKESIFGDSYVVKAEIFSEFFFSECPLNAHIKSLNCKS